MEESVFAIPTAELWKLLNYKEEGLIIVHSDVLKKVVQHGLFRKRSDLEEDPSFKQIIPYAIISSKDSFFLFKRTSRQTERRLHQKYSLGIGGHMNQGNSEELNEHYLVLELKRELFEEVRLLHGCVIEDIKFIGFINDDTIPVGRAHIGLLYSIRVSNREMVINEKDMMTADWIDKADLAEFYEGMETWTKIAFDYYIR